MNASLRSLALLFLLLPTLVSGKCDDHKNRSKVTSLCEDIVHSFGHCEGGYIEGCEDGCWPECVDRWEAARSEDEACGDRYIEVYECVYVLSCEDLYMWSDAANEKTTDHGCAEIELKFRAECPDLELYDLD